MRTRVFAREGCLRCVLQCCVRVVRGVVLRGVRSGREFSVAYELTSYHDGLTSYQDGLTSFQDGLTARSCGGGEEELSEASDQLGARSCDAFSELVGGSFEFGGVEEWVSSAGLPGGRQQALLRRLGRQRAAHRPASWSSRCGSG